MADSGSTFVVKFECGDDRRRVRLSEFSYEAFQQAASEAYADMQEMPPFDLKYRDEDGDFCTLTPSTFVDFLDVTGSQATKLLRLAPRCPAPSVSITPRAAPPPCTTLDAADALQGGSERLDAGDASDCNQCLASAEVAQALPRAAPADASSVESSSSSSSSSESSYASSSTRRLEDAKEACLAAKQAWKEARQHYKDEVKAVRQRMKQEKKEWKREQKEKIKAMKRGGQRFGTPDQELQYADNSHYDELVPLVAADWPAEAQDEEEEDSTPPSPVASILAKEDQPIDEEHQPVAEEGQPTAEKGLPSAEKGQPEPEGKSNLEILKDMGFADVELNAQLLKSHNDDVAAVLNILIG